MRGFFNSLLGEVLRWMSFRLQLNFDPGLAGFFLSGSRGASPIVRELREKTAVKDVIEACGVPHPEIDLIVVLDSNRESALSVDLFWQAAGPARLDVYGFPAPADILPLAPRLQGRHCERFVADGHLGKLARNLRLLGLDTVYRREAEDCFLLRTMFAENRAILTRDRRLLMHSVVQHGYCPRSAQPEEQTERSCGALDYWRRRGQSRLSSVAWSAMDCWRPLQKNRSPTASPENRSPCASTISLAPAQTAAEFIGRAVISTNLKRESQNS